MATQKTRDEIIAELSQCGNLSYQDFIDLLYSILFIADGVVPDNFLSRFTGLWSAGSAVNGKYDIDYYATFNNIIYRSTINNNTDTPGLTSSWIIQGSAGGGYGGVVSTSTNLTPTDNMFVIASGTGTYTHFLDSGGNPLIVADTNLNIFSFNHTTGFWSKISIPITVDLTNYLNVLTGLTRINTAQMFNSTNLITTGYLVSGYRNDTYIRGSDGVQIIGGVAVGWQLAHVIIPAGTTQITVSGLITATSKVWRFTDAAGTLIAGQFGTATATTQTFAVPAAVISSGGAMDINVKRSDEAGTAKDTVMINVGATALPLDVFATYISQILGFDIIAKKANELASGNKVPDPVTALNAVNKQTLDSGLTLKANTSDLSLIQINDMVQANLVSTPAVPIYTYNIDTNKSMIVTGIAGATTVWDVQWTDDITKFSFDYGNGRMWLAIGYTDSTHVAVIGCCQSGNLTGNVVNVDKTVNTFVTKETHGFASFVAGDTGTIERNGDALILSKNGTVIWTYSIAALISLGVNLTNIRFGVALFNSGGTAVTNGSVVAKNMKYYSNALLKDYVLGLSSGNNIKGKNFAFITDSIGTTSYGGNTDATLYHGLMVSKFGINKYVDAISGTAIGGTATDRISAVSRWGALGTTFGNANVHGVVIQGITNDFRARGVVLGDINTTDSTTTYGALKVLYQGLQDTYPNAIIFHMNGIHRKDSTIDPGVFPEQYTRSVGDVVKLADYNKAIDDVARMYGVIVVNSFERSGLSYSNMTPAGSYSPDGLHLYPTGQYRLFQVLAQALNGAYR